jgi:hypothetical protein
MVSYIEVAKVGEGIMVFQQRLAEHVPAMKDQKIKI